MTIDSLKAHADLIAMAIEIRKLIDQYDEAQKSNDRPSADEDILQALIFEEEATINDL